MAAEIAAAWPVAVANSAVSVLISYVILPWLRLLTLAEPRGAALTDVRLMTRIRPADQSAAAS